MPLLRTKKCPSIKTQSPNFRRPYEQQTFCPRMLCVRLCVRPPTRNTQQKYRKPIPLTPHNLTPSQPLPISGLNLNANASRTLLALPFEYRYARIHPITLPTFVYNSLSKAISMAKNLGECLKNEECIMEGVRLLSVAAIFILTASTIDLSDCNLGQQATADNWCRN